MSRQRTSSLLNGLSLLRVILIVPVAALVLIGPSAAYAYVAAALVFMVGAATDFMDGFLARRWHAVTELGGFLDTIADKLLVAGALIALVAVNRASAWVAIIVICREIAVLGLKAVAAGDGTFIRPSIWGKMKFTVQCAAIVLAMLRYPHRLGPLYLDQWMMAAAAVITVLSAADYFGRFASVLGIGRR
ncbi:MAG: CDP-diacylglycerol--glycerol-3-phosphate 3-phosphatidyltransferase [Streptosporangiaceae bacterium]